MEYDDFIKRQRWTFAKTMPKIPHWYIVKDWLSESDQVLFLEFARYINENGVYARFWKYNFPYLHHDGFYYWTMDATIEETTVINRASEETNEIIDGIMYINGVPQVKMTQKTDS